MQKYKNIKAAKLKSYADICHALGEPNRCLIMQYLLQQKEPCAVGQLVAQLKISDATVSHHLRQLEQAGLVKRQRQGRFIYCRATEKGLFQLMLFLRQLTGHNLAEDEAPHGSLPEWGAYSHIWD